jgi:uncharacterized phage protein gp47/JayE
MPNITPDYRQIRADILRDIANLQSSASTGADSDFAIRANATGAAIEGLYQHQQWIVRQIFPDTADSDYLERHASRYGIYRKAASIASGVVRMTGAAGSAVPIGTEGKLNSGIAYVTTVSALIGAGGTVDIPAKAIVAGIAGNQIAGATLTLSAAPASVQSQASIVSMTGGADIEIDADLLVRLLIRIRLPPAGGAVHDYAAWALEVPGVTDAYIYPQRRAVNSVDVVIEVAGGLPSAQMIADVYAHIESMRPVCAGVLVMAPQLVAVNIAAVLTLSGTTQALATAQINSVMQAYFNGLHVGDVVRRVKIESLITGIAGVIDVNLTSPAVNVVPLVDAVHSQIASLGTVTLT